MEDIPVSVYINSFSPVYESPNPERNFGSNQVVFGRHDVARIGDVHQLLHGNGIEGQCHFHLTAVHPLLQLFQTTDATYKVDTLVGTEVFDAKHFIQYQIGGDGYIQYTNGVVIIISTRFGSKAVPLSVQIEGKLCSPDGL